jgi:hypothetical protein
MHVDTRKNGELRPVAVLRSCFAGVSLGRGGRMRPQFLPRLRALPLRVCGCSARLRPLLRAVGGLATPAPGLHMKRPSFVALVTTLALTGCTTGSAARIFPHAGRNLRTCDVPAPAAESPTSRAIRCAEAFIARNGYTDVDEAVDPGRIASESIEYASSLEQLLAWRRGTLRARAFGTCVSDKAERAFTVVFEYAEGGSANGRAVTMSSTFDNLRVQHSDFILSAVTERRHGCRPAEDA